MLCSGCGKEIPFAGTVCPYCRRDKSGDQKAQVLAFTFGAIGGTIGYFVDGIGYAIAGLFIGVIIGAAIGVIMNAGKSKPPEVRVVAPPEAMKPVPASPPSAVQQACGEDDDVTARLGRLDTLKKQGLISESEYTAKRSQILDTL